MRANQRRAGLRGAARLELPAHVRLRLRERQLYDSLWVPKTPGMGGVFFQVYDKKNVCFTRLCIGPCFVSFGHVKCKGPCSFA